MYGNRRVRSCAERRQTASTSGSSTVGGVPSTSDTPPAWRRITGEKAPNSIHRISSSGVGCSTPFSDGNVKNPPMSEPHRLTPDSPIPRPLYTADCSPSKPHEVVGSPPHTTCDERIAPVHPDRLKRTSGRGAEPT